MNILNNNDISLLMRTSPHLFILGAGATKATIPNGDKYGLQSPVMNDFLKEIGASGLLNGVDLETSSNNIEAIYSELVDRPECQTIVSNIEETIVSHYKQMQIPDTPTLYDYLIISLRKKDCIATFNWDPLLIQAYNRVNKITDDLPTMLFLHSSVAVGICYECNYYGPLRNKTCPKCGKDYIMPRLMYPVAKKNYSQDIFIQNQWSVFDDYLQRAGIVTIWGYSAPDSDVDAKERMFKAFSQKFRKLDQIEIIDIADEGILYDKWEPFIKETNFHLNVYRSLMQSIIAEFPRRSMEGYVKRFIDVWWGESTVLLKECTSFKELQDLLSPLLEKEVDNDYNVI